MNVLSLRRVSKYFGGVKAVRDVNLDIVQGERRVLIGPNGAGKTTLFNIIAGDMHPTSGRIEILGHDVTNLPVRKRVRLGMRRTYQTSALFNGLSVYENLYLAVLGAGNLTEHIDPVLQYSGDRARIQRAREVAETVGLENRLETNVAELSHGERRQLEFGLAISAYPKLLLFDEPAAGLSSEERATMMRLILSLERGVTVLLVEHDMDIAMGVADKVTVMNEGSISAEGSPEEIKANEQVQRIYLGRVAHG